MDVAFVLLMGKDPYSEIPFLKREKHFKMLSGQYETYKQTAVFEVINKGGQLVLEGDIMEKISISLIPANNDPEVMKFYQITLYGTLEIEFQHHQDGCITFDYERHLFRKRSYTADLEI